ncbi:MAG TPA: FAD-dependent oxidoreductase [Anaerolineales bacterium]|nr:FAD-dependent oxidoreductase [Anaerolineales bacterium]
MAEDTFEKYLVAVIGAGPAGLFASRLLVANDAHVVLLNRDIIPGGLAEYGIYFDKYKMKEGLRRQFHQILELPGIEYFGNVLVGENGDFRLSNLRAMGFQALLVTAGAQGTKWLGLPGENLVGVYHAKDLVFHYNLLPPFSTRDFHIGRRVALIGAGNVMLDVAHWLVFEQKVEDVVAVVRRGPNEVKFTKEELKYVIHNLDQAKFLSEIERVRPTADAVGQNVDEAKDFILSALPKGLPQVSNTRFRFEFLASPSRILGNAGGFVTGLEVEDTTLECVEGEVQAKRVGTRRTLDVDTVIFCIGDRVDETFGLPIRQNAFVKNPNPLFPVDGLSFEAYDPDLNRPIDRVFMAGWSREASSGLVGVARKDGENGARAVLEYLKTQPGLVDPGSILEELKTKIAGLDKPIIQKSDLKKLEEAQSGEAEKSGLPAYKYATNDEMLEIMGFKNPVSD